MSKPNPEVKEVPKVSVGRIVHFVDNEGLDDEVIEPQAGIVMSVDDAPTGKVVIQVFAYKFDLMLGEVPDNFITTVVHEAAASQYDAYWKYPERI